MFVIFKISLLKYKIKYFSCHTLLIMSLPVAFLFLHTLFSDYTHTNAHTQKHIPLRFLCNSELFDIVLCNMRFLSIGFKNFFSCVTTLDLAFSMNSSDVGYVGKQGNPGKLLDSRLVSLNKPLK